MLGLRDHSAEDLHQAMRLAEEVLQRVITFLKAAFKALSYDFVPYEGQLLVLVKLFSKVQEPSSELLAAARRWFWAISFSEGLRGKPDHYVTRAINGAVRAANGEIKALDYRLDLSPQIFINRRFIKGRALSAAVASMLAVGNAQSLVSGKLIDAERYMTEFSGENYLGLYPHELIQETAASNIASSKIFANTILVSEDDIQKVRESTPKDLVEALYSEFGNQQAEEILASQFISPTAARMVLEERFTEFVDERARTLYEAAASLASPQ